MGTSERSVHGGGPGKQAYLILIEESAPPTDAQGPISRADAATGGGLQRASEEINRYWLEIAHRKEDRE